MAFLPMKESAEEKYIAQLEDQLLELETPVLEMMERLSDRDRAVLDSYIYAMRELQLYGMIHAYKKGKGS